MTYKEHAQSLQVDVFDGYAVYTIKDTQNSQKVTEPEREPARESEPIRPGSFEPVMGV